MDKLDTILACLPESPYKATFTEEIESLRQQLLAALAVCEEKDEWVRFLSTVENIDDVEKALAIQPDASALNDYRNQVIEECAKEVEAKGPKDGNLALITFGFSNTLRGLKK